VYSQLLRFRESNTAADFRRILRARGLCGRLVDRGGTTQAIRPFGVCSASDAVEIRAGGIPMEAVVMRRALAKMKTQNLKFLIVGGVSVEKRR
jgi:hypothetical protein